MKSAPQTRLLATILILLLSLFSTLACGENGGSGGGDGDGDTQEVVGDEEESSFNVSIEDESGDSTSATGKQSNEDVSEDSWGASLNSGMLMINLVTGAGISITANLETSESNTAPGTFTVQAPPEGTHVVLLDVLQGAAFSSQSTGSITLQNCPKAIGDKVVGSFNNIVLVDDMGAGGTRTLNGNFDVMVYAVAGGGLFCEETPEPGDGGDGDTETPIGGQCGWEYCRDDGACCPYAECMNTCDFNCLFNDSDCAMGTNPLACDACIESCYFDTCGISDQCVNAAVDLGICEDTHGCDEFDDDNEAEACMQNFCCDDLKATY